MRSHADADRKTQNASSTAMFVAVLMGYVQFLVGSEYYFTDYGMMALLIAMVIIPLLGMSASTGALAHEEEHRERMERTPRRGASRTQIFYGEE